MKFTAFFINMKYIILSFSLLFSSVPVLAQGNKTLRDSLSHAVELLSYHPDSLDLRLKKAGWNIELEQWQYAKDEYDYVLKRDARNIAALYYRAYVNDKLGRYNFARLDYEALLREIPDNFEAQLGLALLNQKDHRYTEAFDQINRLVSQYPDSAVAYAARAGIEAERGMNELAVGDYEEAILRDPSNTDYRISMIDRLIVLKRMDEAKRRLDELVRMGIPRASLSELYQRCKKK